MREYVVNIPDQHGIEWTKEWISSIVAKRIKFDKEYHRNEQITTLEEVEAHLRMWYLANGIDPDKGSKIANTALAFGMAMGCVSSRNEVIGDNGIVIFGLEQIPLMYFDYTEFNGQLASFKRIISLYPNAGDLADAMVEHFKPYGYTRLEAGRGLIQFPNNLLQEYLCPGYASFKEAYKVFSTVIIGTRIHSFPTAWPLLIVSSAINT